MCLLARSAWFCCPGLPIVTIGASMPSLAAHLCASIFRSPPRSASRAQGLGAAGMAHRRQFAACVLRAQFVLPGIPAPSANVGRHLRTRTSRYFRSQIAGRGSVPAAPHVLIAELGACADPGSCHLFLRPVPGENLIENNGAERGGADTSHGEVAELERQIAGASGERGSDCDKISRV
jgi:hypothetical protein